MTSALEAVGRIRVWQVVVLLAVVALSAGGAYAAYDRLTAEDPAELEEDQRLIAVRRGDFVNEVSVDGSLVYTNRDTLGFGAAGTVLEVAAQEGRRVREGEVLARLDGETISDLERRIVRAQGDLRTAQEALAQARRPYAPIDLARARADVANAKADRAAAQNDLERMGVPDPQAVARAEAAIEDARLSLRNAERALDDLMEPPTPQAVAQAELDVASARRDLHEARRDLDRLLVPSDAALADAQAAVADAQRDLDAENQALEDLTAGPEQRLLDAAQSDLDAARAALEDAELGRSLAEIDWNDRLKAAQKEIDDASERYAAVFSKWLGVALREDEMTQPPADLVAAWELDLDALLAGTEGYFGYRTAHLEPTPDDPNTRWNERAVYMWMNFYPGNVVADCDDDDPPQPHLGICVMRAFRDAWTPLKAKLDDVETLKLQHRRAMDQVNGGVTRARQSIADVQRRIQDLHVPPDELDVRAARARVDAATRALSDAQQALVDLNAVDDLEVEEQRRRIALAEKTLDAARSALEDLRSAPDAADVEAADLRILRARLDLDSAETELQNLLEEPGPAQVEAAQERVALAGANVADLERKLADVQAGADPLVVSLREGDVAAANSTLDSLRRQLERSVITAPWDGIVTNVRVEAGQEVGLGAPAIDLVDPSTVQVSGTINEVDVLQVREGAQAAVTLDALPGQALTGTVSEIGPQTTSQEIGQFNPFSPQTASVLYPITIRVEPPRGAQLPEGLTALASIVLREEPDVLLVPIDALFGAFQQPLLKVMTDGVLEDRPIVIGSSDDFWAVVESGVSEGEMVVLETRDASGFGMFGRFGGGSVTIVEP